MKLFFILSEVALAAAFGVTTLKDKRNVSAVLEWTIAFLYGIFVISFAIDFLPALDTKHGEKGQPTEMQMAEEGRESILGNGHNGMRASGDTHGYGYPATLPSRNF